MLTQICRTKDLDASKLKELSCGLRAGSYDDVLNYSPLVADIIHSLITLAQYPIKEYSYDVKLHMLMPKQYPCIPNWHWDNVPRVDGKLRHDLATPSEKMYVWVSGFPVPEFEDGFLKPSCWYEFDQTDKHRGTVSTKFQWRLFIRANPITIRPIKKDPQRRHSQVYLDSSEFLW